MATTKNGPIPLTEKQFAGEVGKRLASSGAISKLVGDASRDDGVTEESAAKFGAALVKAFKDELTDCIVNGYKVTLNGVLKVEPKYVPEKKKGEMVRNPSTGETTPRAKAEPAAFKVKATASSALKKFFPTLRTKAGKELEAQLAPKAKGSPKVGAKKVAGAKKAVPVKSAKTKA